MADPFRIQGPAVISFSGGRTSGYMLFKILQAHGGTLPDDVVVCFANTGREMPATLDFVRDCGAAWDVRVVWLEFVSRTADGFAVVSHNSASRDGEPFTALIAQKHMLPNVVMRFCTEELKIFTIKRWVLRTLGWNKWTEVIGLRADEPKRLARCREGCVTPLAEAGITKPDVLTFWAEQPFDLRLAGPWEGNCDGCFQKSRAARMRMLRDHPTRMRWWSQTETTGAYPYMDNPRMAQFSSRESWAELAEFVERTPRLPLDETMHDLGEACDGGCGV
jgi:hypothetical protein